MRIESARGSSVFGAQSPGPPVPLSTLRRTPRDAPRKIKVRIESLLLFCRALSSPTTCRFIPAHSHPCVALSSAQVSPGWINRNLAAKAFAANGDNSLNFVSHSRGSVQPAGNYPDLIMLWQYAEGVLLPRNGGTAEGLHRGVSEESLTLQRSEFSRRLAKFIVAAEIQTSVEYLTKLCRKWDP